MSERNKGFFAAHLDPGAIFGEILFGLIMVLTFTLGAGIVVDEGPGAYRALLAAALGCNLAWGIIDGAMYLMGCLLDRGRRNRMLLALRNVQDEETALRAIGGELDAPLATLATQEERRAFYRSLWTISARAQPVRIRIGREDWLGAFASGWLVVLTSFPAVVPFLFMDDPWRALRVSNGILVGLLFFCGFYWARFTGVNRWVAGAGMMGLGVALVAVAIALGG